MRAAPPRGDLEALTYGIFVARRPRISPRGPGGTCLSLAQINPTTAPAAELTVFCRVDYFAKYALPGWAISTLMLRSLPKSALNGTIRNFFVHGTCL